jgi:hypothetical protein
MVEIISNFNFQGGEYSSTVKNRQKLSLVHHRVGGEELNMKYMYMKNIKNETVHVFHD